MRIFQRVRTVEAVNQIDLFTGKPDGRERRRRQHKRKPPRAPMPARTGAQERDTGIDAVLEHTPESWKMEWLQTIAAMPSGTIFNSDDVRAIVGDPPKGVHHNAIGGLMYAARVRGLAESIPAHNKSERPKAHARELVKLRRV
jgi:hypothetical protein